MAIINMATQLTTAWTLGNNKEDSKIMIFSDDGRYIGVKKLITVDSYNYILAENNNEYNIKKEVKCEDIKCEDIKLRHIVDNVFLGTDEKLYELEKIHQYFSVAKEVCKDDYVDYLHLII